MVPSTIELYILYIYSYMYIYSRYIYITYIEQRYKVQGTRYSMEPDGKGGTIHDFEARHILY